MLPSEPEVTIIRRFFIKGHPRRSHSPIPVIWQPPKIGWFKVNIDGAALGSPGPAAGGGIFRNHLGDFIGGFSVSLGSTLAFRAELIATMYAIELSFRYGWRSLWLESDSELVVRAFATPSVVPWDLRNRWQNCLSILPSMRFYVTHIFREGNICADWLAKYGLSQNGLLWLSSIPAPLFSLVQFNKSGMPAYRFCF